MYFVGGILSFFVCLFVSSIDLNFLNKKERIKVSIRNIKKYYNLINFIIIFFVNLYLISLFLNNNILYIINLLCFLCIYICSVTDIICKNIFLDIILSFACPIIFFNIYGNYILSKLFYGMEAFGIGDIYVLSLIGLSTDWYTVFNIGLFAFVIAGIFYFIKYIFVRKLQTFKHQEIPLVPFILSSYLILIYF